MKCEALVKAAEIPLGYWISPALAVFFTIAAFVLLGIIAFKFGIVRWRWDEANIDSNPLAAVGFRDSEGKVYTLPIIKDRQDAMREELKRLDSVDLTLEKRQSDLRETILPRDYVRKSDVADVKEMIKDLNDTLTEFLESCRKGECGAKRALLKGSGGHKPGPSHR